MDTITNRLHCLSAAALLAAALLTAPMPAVALKSDSGDQLYYRYIDDSGTSVWSQTLPSKYVGKGYDLVTASGRVEKTVAPALSPEDAKLLRLKREEEEKLAIWDKELKRRYSNVREIEMARDRKLAEVERNISVIKSNVRGVTQQIEDQHAIAANKERAGQPVPELTLKRLESLEGELDFFEAEISQRRELYDAITQKFARDIERFAVIKK